MLSEYLSPGKYSFQITPTRTYTGSTIAVAFGDDFGPTAANDILYCYVNSVRRRCTFTLNPFTVTITALLRGMLIANTITNITITSDFSAPATLGIQAASTPGWHSVNISILTGTAIQEQIGDFVYVYPSGTPLFAAAAVPTSASQYAMYTFNIQLTQALPSNLNTGVRGRMFIDFPVSFEGIQR